MNQFLFLLFPTLLLCLGSGCTRAPERQSTVSQIVQERLNTTVSWTDAESADNQVQCEIQQLLDHEVTVEAAIQIALLNNPRIQADFERIGISKADLIEAGLFSNPLFDLFIRYPNKKGYVSDVEYSVTASFIDLFLIPLKIKVAEAELEKTTLQVTNDLLEVAFEVEQTYYELQTARQRDTITQAIAKVCSILYEIALRQNERHNINQLEFQQNHLAYLEASIEITRVQNEIIRLKEKLNVLLGLRKDTSYTISNEFPAFEYPFISLERLETIACEERLDIQASRCEIVRLCTMLGITQWWVYTNGRIGIGGERDPNHLNTLGPAISTQIPICNYGQAARLRLQAQLREAQDQLALLETHILSQVRRSYTILENSLHMLNEYKNHIVPLQQQALESCEKLYNVMGTGITSLLEKKREELQTQNRYLQATCTYWLAKVQLDKALGGRLYQKRLKDRL